MNVQALILNLQSDFQVQNRTQSSIPSPKIVNLILTGERNIILAVLIDWILNLKRSDLPRDSQTIALLFQDRVHLI